MGPRRETTGWKYRFWIPLTAAWPECSSLTNRLCMLAADFVVQTAWRLAVLPAEQLPDLLAAKAQAMVRFAGLQPMNLMQDAKLAKAA
jgi:hypothetical protein